MGMLLLKMWRDMLSRKGQFFGLAVVVALGISTFVAFQTGYLDLTRSVDRATGELRFADFSTSLLGAPAEVVASVRALPGVRAAEGRLVQDLALDLGDGQRAIGRIVGLPDAGRPEVNDLLIQAGTWPVRGRAEAILHTKFAQETGIRVGDTLSFKLGREHRRVRIVGIAASPEYMYAVPQKGSLPSPREFAVLFLRAYDAEKLLGQPGRINDVSVLVAPGHPVEEVIGRVERLIGKARVVASVRRADQASAFMIGEEIEQNRIMALFLPGVILAISSSSLFIALSRLVTAQRREIGLAKAMGYSDGQVLAQYLAIAVVIAAGGALMGFGLGDLIARAVAEQYVSLLGVPFLEHRIYPEVLATAVLISAAACVLAGLAPAWRSARIAPAMAMHADPNAALTGGHLPWVERLLGPVMPATFTVRIPLRNLFRAKRRSLSTIIGIALALVLSVATQSMFDAMDELTARVATFSERWDVQAVFAETFGAERVAEVSHWAGVNGVQAALVTSLEVRTGRGVHQGSLTCAEPPAAFHGFEILAGPAAQQALSSGGLVMTERIAEKLGVWVGGTVQIRSPHREAWTEVPVAAITRETLGAPMYGNLQLARRLTGEVDRFNALYVEADAWLAEAVKERLTDIHGAVGVVVKADMLARFAEMMQFTTFYQGLLLAFGLAMAFVVVYNTMTANVLERTREIATMRTIGESTGRLAWMITIENLLLGLFAAPLGIWGGVLVADALYAQLSSEAFTMTAVILPRSVAVIVGCLVAVLLLSEIPPIRRIVRLDLAESTKVME